MDRDQLRQSIHDGPWEDRVDAVRSIPHHFAGKDHAAAYAAAAGAYYVEQLAPHFHLVPWLPKYADRAGFVAAYDAAAKATNDFTAVSPAQLEQCIRKHPAAIRIFRLMTGYSVSELAEAVTSLGGVSISASLIDRLEGGGKVTPRQHLALGALAQQVHGIIAGTGGYTVPSALQIEGFRAKTDKPDTAAGWATVAQWHANKVPYADLLYQRFYGGAFRQLQDAGGSKKGDLLEDATEKLFADYGVPYVRTVRGTQATAGDPFGVQVRPAPDFIVHDGHNARGFVECKSAGDGGTARDKAGRFHGLRSEANRIGGISVIGVLDGFGWRRLPDALGPVVRDTAGLVFSAANLADLLSVEPVAGLVGTVAPPDP